MTIKKVEASFYAVLVAADEDTPVTFPPLTPLRNTILEIRQGLWF
jgi:hypothetical protein